MKLIWICALVAASAFWFGAAFGWVTVDPWASTAAFVLVALDLALGALKAAVSP